MLLDSCLARASVSRTFRPSLASGPGRGSMLCLVVGVADGGENFAGRRGAGLAEDDFAVLPDHHHGSVNAAAVRLGGAVGVRDLEALVDQQVEREVIGVDEGLMAGGV